MAVVKYSPHLTKPSTANSSVVVFIPVRPSTLVTRSNCGVAAKVLQTRHHGSASPSVACVAEALQRSKWSCAKRTPMLAWVATMPW